MSPDLFHRGQPKTPDGLQRHCRICRRRVRRAQYAAHRERDKALTRAWAAAHPEQAKASQGRAHRVWNLRRSLATGALTRRLVRETQRTAALARVRRMLRADPAVTPAQVAASTGWPYSTAYKRLLDVRSEQREVA